MHPTLEWTGAQSALELLNDTLQEILDKSRLAGQSMMVMS
jgi:hypothetical protein